jgi:hypothetical protein
MAAPEDDLLVLRQTIGGQSASGEQSATGSRLPSTFME